MVATVCCTTVMFASVNIEGEIFEISGGGGEAFAFEVAKFR